MFVGVKDSALNFGERNRNGEKYKYVEIDNKCFDFEKTDPFVELMWYILPRGARPGHS